MNRFTTLLACTRLRRVARLHAAALLIFTTAVAARAEAPAPGTNRFLFIVDCSSTMKGWEEPLSLAVFDFVYSGVRGAMTNGDSYGVWLAGGDNDTSAGVESWKPKFAMELAARASLRVKERGAKGKPALQLAVKDATEVARNVGDLTTIIISNGDTPIRGTGFDAEINAAIAAVSNEMRRVKQTVNVVLVARDGEFVAWSVNSPDFLVAMPQLPPRRSKPVVAEIAPSAPPPKTSTAAPPLLTPAPLPRVAAAPLIVTRETVDREKQVLRAMASTDAPTVSQSTNSALREGTAPRVTNTSAVAVPQAQPTMQGALTAEASTNRVVEPAAVPASTNTAPVATNASTSSGTVTQVVAQAGSEPKPDAAAIAPTGAPTSVTPPAKLVAPRQGISIYVWAAAGALLAVFVTVAILWIRTREPEPSLVSQAAMLERWRQ